MDTISPEQFDELMAYDAVEGIGTDKIVRVIAVGFAAVLSSLSGKTVKPDDLLPLYRPSRKPLGKAQQQIASIRASLGGR